MAEEGEVRRQEMQYSEERKKERTISSFPASFGLIRCLVPTGGPADVYTLAIGNQATPMTLMSLISSCHM